MGRLPPPRPDRPRAEARRIAARRRPCSARATWWPGHREHGNKISADRNAKVGIEGSLWKVRIVCHTFRATGVTAYLENGCLRENAPLMASHENPRTTSLGNRTGDEITLDEIERIAI